MVQFLPLTLILRILHSICRCLSSSSYLIFQYIIPDFGRLPSKNRHSNEAIFGTHNSTQLNSVYQHSTPLPMAFLVYRSFNWSVSEERIVAGAANELRRKLKIPDANEAHSQILHQLHTYLMIEEEDTHLKVEGS